MSLQSEDMGKLVAGQSVLRRDDGGLHVFQRAKSPPSRLICTRSMSGSVERFYAPERFTLVGSRGSDGWIEGEWDESPAGLFKGEYRYFDHSVERGLSDEVCWSSVIAFRPAHREAQPETDGGGEGVTNMDRVREFHETFGIPVLASPCIPADRVALRLDILDEERRELSEALEAGDVVQVADALTDMAYLICGTALEFGIDLNACFAEVHRSNMSKLGGDGKPIYREDGKVLKGPNYSPPDLRTFLAALASKGV